MRVACWARARRCSGAESDLHFVSTWTFGSTFRNSACAFRPYLPRFGSEASTVVGGRGVSEGTMAVDALLAISLMYVSARCTDGFVAGRQPLTHCMHPTADVAMLDWKPCPISSLYNSLATVGEVCAVVWKNMYAKNLGVPLM